MGERRSGEGGTAMFYHFLMNMTGAGQACGPCPDAKKFEGKWFGGEEPDNEFDQLIQHVIEKETDNPDNIYKEHMEKTGMRLDNIYWRMYGVNTQQMTLPTPQNLPAFSDLVPGAEFYVAMDMQRYAQTLRLNWDHCVGSFGEDHPTCKKARWHYEMQVAPQWASFYEELQELGHWDAAQKYGIKPRMSFLPKYQPEKKNIPGAYEHYRSEKYMEGWNPDGTGSINYPFLFRD